jgi:hypothetical protein
VVVEVALDPELVRHHDSAPAGARPSAEMPAALVRLVVVTVMAGSLVLRSAPGGMSGHVKDATNRRGDLASPCDVT